MTLAVPDLRTAKREDPAEELLSRATTPIPERSFGHSQQSGRGHRTSVARPETIDSSRIAANANPTCPFMSFSYYYDRNNQFHKSIGVIEHACHYLCTEIMRD